jgi:hypothetical protein
MHAPPVETSPSSNFRSPKRTRIFAGGLLAASIIILMAAELICRFAVGLGDPPLYEADPRIEYLLQPSKTYDRFHKRFAVNRYSMRADDFPPEKSSVNELRVIVVGDSVIYGGVRIDQSEIDTEILKRSLHQQTGRPVVVGNASAKSWGPPNELAYLQRFGTLQADVIVLELSSHDYADVPIFAPVVGVTAAYPDRKPPLALVDLFRTYILPRYLHIGETPAGIEKTSLDDSPSPQDIAQCRDAERELFRFARAHLARVALMQHLSLPEINGGFQPGYYANQKVAMEEGVPYVDDASELRDKLRQGKSPFYPGEMLHLNETGQAILAHSLQAAVDLAVETK